MKRDSDDRQSSFLAGRGASFRAAFSGLFFMIRSETNARLHLFAMVTVVACGIFFGLTKMEWCAISLAIGLVIAAEAMNTAIERLVDMVSPEFSQSAGLIKDIAAGGVLVASIAASVVGGLVFAPRFVAAM